MHQCSKTKVSLGLGELCQFINHNIGDNNNNNNNNNNKNNNNSNNNNNKLLIYITLFNIQ